jgi:SH3 domain protein
VIKTIVLLLCLGGYVGAAQGATMYVTDQFKITMRSGESTGHKIVRMLPSGTPVNVLSSNSATGYTKVEALGEVGFVLTRQLENEPSARDQVAKLRERLQALQAAPDQLHRDLAQLQSEHQTLQKTHRELERRKQQLEQELESIRRTASDAVRINNERNELRKNVAALTRERENLKQENRDLSNQTAQHWFMIGAAVVVVGIVLGLILPHLRFQRRKSSWGSL